MTTATVKVKEEFDIEGLHPVLSNRWQTEQAGKELARLEEAERKLSGERLELIKGTESPRTQSRLNEIEKEIPRLQTLQRREADKIKSLTDELPQLRKEAEQKIEELIELESRIEELSAEVKSVNYELWELCTSATGSKISGLASKRGRLVEELEKMPFSIRDIRSYFHVQPTATELQIPAVDQKVLALGEALTRLTEK